MHNKPIQTLSSIQSVSHLKDVSVQISQKLVLASRIQKHKYTCLLSLAFTHTQTCTHTKKKHYPLRKMDLVKWLIKENKLCCKCGKAVQLLVLIESIQCIVYYKKGSPRDHFQYRSSSFLLLGIFCATMPQKHALKPMFLIKLLDFLSDVRCYFHLFRWLLQFSCTKVKPTN